MKTYEIKRETDEIKKCGEKIRLKDLVYNTNKYKYEFQEHEAIRSFGETIYNDTISIHEAETNQSSLLDELTDFTERSRGKMAGINLNHELFMFSEEEYF